MTTPAAIDGAGATPETDALNERIAVHRKANETPYQEMRNHARRLERDRNRNAAALKLAVDGLKEINDILPPGIGVRYVASRALAEIEAELAKGAV